MRSFISNQKGALLTFLIVSVFQGCTPTPQFTCPQPSDDLLPLPKFPNAYSKNIRVNYPKQQYTVELKHILNLDDNKEAMEIWDSKRHVKYIKIGNQQLLIKYDNDVAPTCTVKTISNVIELEGEDAGPNNILGKVFELFYDKKEYQSKFVYSDATLENSVYVKKWEGCFVNPKVNVSLTFTDKNWGQAHTSFLHKDLNYPVSLEVQANNDFLTALYSNFNPVMPAATEFQPPENVYCEGFRDDKKLPIMTDYFSYDSEIIVYESVMGIAPISSHRTVYYDFPAGIARTDFYDPLAEDGDLFSPVTAKGVSIIHDFNSGVQYSLDPTTGSCKVESFTVTVDPINVKATGKGKMPKGLEFFSLNGLKLSYNGQFPTRGYTADVFTAPVTNSKEKLLYTWYFSSDRTQVVENENVEKDVLLRMVVRPEAAEGKDREVNVNFYNFAKEEPSVFMYDVTSCYSDSLSKTFVLTFPVNKQLKDSPKLLKNYIHLAIKTVTGVSKQRVFVTQVSFSDQYMYAEFKLLATPDALTKVKTPSKESTLAEAVEKLKSSVSGEKFTVTVQANNSVLILRPEPNGLNEFAGDRKANLSGSTYKEGSVIGLTIGMLLLGFILGGVTLNLIVSRKFGVSLFQKSNANRDPFNSLGESSM